MARRQSFLAAAWATTWQESYARLSADRQRGCDQAAMALIKQDTGVGLRVKPILPEKRYLEARINSGDRVVFRIEAGTIYFVDIVSHDDIGRYGRRP